MKNFTSTLARLFLVAGLLVGFSTSALAQENEAPPTEEDAPAEKEEMKMADESMDAAAQDIAAILDERGTFTTLLSALQQTGLAETLKSGDTYTVFAPTDEAFAALPAGTLDSLSAEQLSGILSYHVVPGSVSLADAAEEGTITTAQGANLTVESDPTGALMVNGTPVTAEAIEADNGVVYIVDAVLMPPQGASGSSSSK